MREKIKAQFLAELEPLLLQTEQAILAKDSSASTGLSLRVMDVVSRYAAQLEPDDFRDALNSPLARAIAKRLGVQP